MEEVPFRVAAKTARLIGRENISDTNGAIGELVKNAYDADATHCCILFVPAFPESLESFSETEVERIVSADPSQQNPFELVSQVSDAPACYRLTDNLTDDALAEVKSRIRSLFNIWVADNGSGMTGNVIRANWMTIGTDFKEASPSSQSGRRRVGAKGIGRFAMDKLARKCRLLTFPAGEGERPIEWNVDWDAFDAPLKTLDQVKAIIRPLGGYPLDYIDGLHGYNEGRRFLTEIYNASPQGSILQLQVPRDEWSERDVEKLRKYLERLSPPTEQREFIISVFDYRHSEQSGRIEAPVLDDFDYRMSVVSNGNSFEITITRNELRAEDIDPDVFKEEEMLPEYLQPSTLQGHSYSYERSLGELFPRAQSDLRERLRSVGAFQFEMSFYKLGRGARGDNFPYRATQFGVRKTWLNQHGGIKIYRDDFFVRPYGDPSGKSFDWLQLGERRAENPAGAGRKGWRVGPQQVVGTVRLSQDSNPRLTDQANREGIISNDSFDALQVLLTRLIQEFEDDRSLIMSNIKAVSTRKSEAAAKLEEAAQDAQDVKSDPNASAREQRLASALENRNEEILDHEDELRSLQALATLGTVLVSFTHEVTKTRDKLTGRMGSLQWLLEKELPRARYENTDNAFNPYYWIEENERVDKSVGHWFDFALGTLKGRRRRRIQIELKSYINDFEKNWDGFFEFRGVKFTPVWVDDCAPTVLAHKLDLDSIFNNLVLNTIEAVVGDQHEGDRVITVTFSETDSDVLISYRDNGPGLAPSIDPPTRIFDFNFSTKLDDEGNPAGSGIGLWILDSVISSYSGATTLPKSDTGFALDIRLPKNRRS